MARLRLNFQAQESGSGYALAEHGRIVIGKRLLRAGGRNSPRVAVASIMSVARYYLPRPVTA